MTSLQKYISENGIEDLVDSLEKALERMKPKKPDNSGKFKRTCFCGKTVYIGVNKFCSDCGQALDWSE